MLGVPTFPPEGLQSGPYQLVGSETGAREFLIPYSFPEAFRNPSITTDWGSGKNTALVYTSAPITANSIFLPVVYYAYGEDIRIGRFRQTPSINLLATATATPAANYFT